MGRSPCCDKTRVKRGPWSHEEDAILRSFVQRFGNAGNWISLPQKAGLKRCGKSCRLRWLNYLRPELRHGGFTDDEDNLILSLYAELGSKWSVIASRLPGRTDNDVKNYWNTKLKKRYHLAAATRSEETRPPSPAAAATPAPPSGDDDSAVAAAAAADSLEAQQDEETPLPLTPAPLTVTDLVDAAFATDTGDGDAAVAAADDDMMLLLKSEQLYAELMGLVQKQSSSQTATTGGGDDEAPSTTTTTTAAAAAPSSSSSGATSSSSPAVSSSSGSCSLLWPTTDGVHGTALPSEPINTGLFDAYGVGGDVFGAAAYSFQDLLQLASSYDDDVTAAVTQELLYYQ